MTITKKQAKAKKPLAWSHKATPRAAIAISELIKLQEKQAVLAKKSLFLRELIIKEGGGSACGVRAAIRHQRASSSWRLVKVKESTRVVLLKGAKS